MGTQSKRLAVAHFCAGPRAAAGRRKAPPLLCADDDASKALAQSPSGRSRLLSTIRLFRLPRRSAVVAQQRRRRRPRGSRSEPSCAGRFKAKATACRTMRVGDLDVGSARSSASATRRSGGSLTIISKHKSASSD